MSHPGEHPVDAYIRLLKSVKTELETCEKTLEPYKCNSLIDSKLLIGQLLKKQEEIRKCFEKKLEEMNKF